MATAKVKCGTVTSVRSRATPSSRVQHRRRNVEGSKTKREKVRHLKSERKVGDESKEDMAVRILRGMLEVRKSSGLSYAEMSKQLRSCSVWIEDMRDFYRRRLQPIGVVYVRADERFYSKSDLRSQLLNDTQSLLESLAETILRKEGITALKVGVGHFLGAVKSPLHKLLQSKRTSTWMSACGLLTDARICESALCDRFVAFVMEAFSGCDTINSDFTLEPDFRRGREFQKFSGICFILRLVECDVVVDSRLLKAKRKAKEKASAVAAVSALPTAAQSQSDAAKARKQLFASLAMEGEGMHRVQRVRYVHSDESEHSAAQNSSDEMSESSVAESDEEKAEVLDDEHILEEAQRRTDGRKEEEETANSSSPSSASSSSGALERQKHGRSLCALRSYVPLIWPLRPVSRDDMRPAFGHPHAGGRVLEEAKVVMARTTAGERRRQIKRMRLMERPNPRTPSDTSESSSSSESNADTSDWSSARVKAKASGKGKGKDKQSAADFSQKLIRSFGKVKQSGSGKGVPAPKPAMASGRPEISGDGDALLVTSGLKMRTTAQLRKSDPMVSTVREHCGASKRAVLVACDEKLELQPLGAERWPRGGIAQALHHTVAYLMTAKAKGDAHYPCRLSAVLSAVPPLADSWEADGVKEHGFVHIRQWIAVAFAPNIQVMDARVHESVATCIKLADDCAHCDLRKFDCVLQWDTCDALHFVEKATSQLLAATANRRLKAEIKEIVEAILRQIRIGHLGGAQCRAELRICPKQFRETARKVVANEILLPVFEPFATVPTVCRWLRECAEEKRKGGFFLGSALPTVLQSAVCSWDLCALPLTAEVACDSKRTVVAALFHLGLAVTLLRKLPINAEFMDCHCEAMYALFEDCVVHAPNQTHVELLRYAHFVPRTCADRFAAIRRKLRASIGECQQMLRETSIPSDALRNKLRILQQSLISIQH